MTKAAKTTYVASVDRDSASDLQKHYRPIAIKAVAAALAVKATTGSKGEMVTVKPLGARPQLESD